MTEARGGHDFRYPVVKEKGLCDGSNSKACRYLRTEECTKLQAPPPLLARTEAVPCWWDSSKACLSDATFTGWYDAGHKEIVIPMAEGNEFQDVDDAFEHEAIHHLRYTHFGDYWSHDGPEWACE